MKQNTLRKTFLAGAIAISSVFAHSTAWAEQETVRAVMAAPLRVLDPILSTNSQARNHGYMIYDTLLSMDEKFQVHPQMADWKVSEDGKVYTFTLREGLKWHDGSPVTAEDCVASINRWGQRDGMGIKLLGFTESVVATDDKTITLTLRENVNFVLEALGKVTTNVPFMMPKRIADTPATEAIKEFIGSGPFKFVAEEFQPGIKAVYVKNPDYIPRSEPSNWTSGGKVVNVDRVEWVVMPDALTAINALASGEIDYIDEPAHDLLSILDGNPDVKVENFNPYGLQIIGRFNFLSKPFDDVKVRKAAQLAMSQESFLAALSSDPQYTKKCGAVLVCETPYASETGSEALVAGSGMEEARRTLKESSYDGSPIKIVQPTEVSTQKPQPIVAAQLLKDAGFNVTMMPMSFDNAMAMRADIEAARNSNYNIFFTAQDALAVSNPLTSLPLNATGDTGWHGWAKDAELEKLRDEFAKASDAEAAKSVAEQIQARVMDQVTYLPLGELRIPLAYSAKLQDMPKSPVPVFWSMTKAD